jgi:hypothetical protein
MARPDTILIEDRAYSWRAFVEQRKAQLEAWRKARRSRPRFRCARIVAPGASAPGRYQEPTLLQWLREGNR